MAVQGDHRKCNIGLWMIHIMPYAAARHKSHACYTDMQYNRHRLLSVHIDISACRSLISPVWFRTLDKRWLQSNILATT